MFGSVGTVSNNGNALQYVPEAMRTAVVEYRDALQRI